LSSSENIGVVILAAGASTRLGEPKQLLEYDHKNLLQRVIDAAVNSNANTVIVILGSTADQISSEIDKSKVNVIINTEWEEGMASSVRNGLNELLFISPSTDAVILMVCDQPYVSSELINDLIDKQKETGKLIIACNYGETFGPPALFHKSLFHELMHLKGDVGARKIIQHHSNEVATVPFTKGKIDIDTKEDYDALNNS
jgi:molybdenum cofactor cytidylyltransferase